jgi:hypothetical protein
MAICCNSAGLRRAAVRISSKIQEGDYVRNGINGMAGRLQNDDIMFWAMPSGVSPSAGGSSRCDILPHLTMP